MGRLLGYMSNRADRLRDALQQERIELAPVDAAGWGIGFYQGGEVLHKKRPLLEGDVLDWEQVANGVTSDCAIVHVREATVGDFRTENTHPFRMRSWLFAHSGTIANFAALRPRLVEALPDFLRRNVQGETDSEHLFHVVLSRLHDAGQLDNPDVDEAVVRRAIRSTIEYVDTLAAEAGGPTPTLNLVLTNGRRMFALRRGAPMHYVQRTGSARDETAPDWSSASALRYVLVVCNGETAPSDYVAVEEASVLVIDRSLDVRMQPL